MRTAEAQLDLDVEYEVCKAIKAEIVELPGVWKRLDSTLWWQLGDLTQDILQAKLWNKVTQEVEDTVWRAEYRRRSVEAGVGRA